MRPEVYSLWREQWQIEHPNQLPPTIEQVSKLMDMFGFTEKTLCGAAILARAALEAPDGL